MRPSHETNTQLEHGGHGVVDNMLKRWCYSKIPRCDDPSNTPKKQKRKKNTNRKEKAFNNQRAGSGT